MVYRSLKVGVIASQSRTSVSERFLANLEPFRRIPGYKPRHVCGDGASKDELQANWGKESTATD